MAEYIKFRLTAAKAGVSMALLALLAGIVGERESGAAEIHATPAAASFLNLRGTQGNTRTALIKLEQKALKLDVALAKIERNYLKIRDANTQFLKIRSANARFHKDETQFLKITDAASQFLKITDAASQFLKITDANSRFLKIDGTAANAQKVGGIGPDQLIQGRGQVLSNALVPSSDNQMLLGDGSVRVLIALLRGSQPTVTLENDTASSLNFTVVGGTSQSNSIPPNGGQTTITPNSSTSPTQLDIQMFGGGGGAGRVWTTTLSVVGQQAVGQMVVGLL